MLEYSQEVFEKTPLAERAHMKRKKFLEYESHKFLMKSREQRDPEWVRTNKELEERARAGEDEAFFRLLERNPEYIKTDLAMGKIMEWQYAIQYLRPFARAKETYRTPKQEIREFQKKIAKARENLLRIGKILAFEEGRDERGKPYGPYLFDIYYTYRGLRSLFRGIKKLGGIKEETEEDVYDYLLCFMEEFESNFMDEFGPICEMIGTLRTFYGLNRETVQNIVFIKPSAFALEVTAKIFNLSERTVQAYLKRFTSEVRDEVFEYLSYSSTYLGKKGQPTYFKFLTSMIAFENLRGVDTD